MGGGWEGDRIEDGKDGGGVEGKRQKRCWRVPEDLFPEDLFPEDLFRYTKTPFFFPWKTSLSPRPLETRMYRVSRKKTS